MYACTSMCTRARNYVCELSNVCECKACTLYLAQASSETKTGFDLGFARGSREQKANDAMGCNDLYASGSSFAVSTFESLVAWTRIDVI
jgi:hypothetical protein